METTEEWNKVKSFIAEKVTKSGSYTHWYIGLRKKSRTWKWTEAGSPDVTVAIDDNRWQPGQPSPSTPGETCGEIWYPANSENPGHFNDVYCNVKYHAQTVGNTAPPRGYICENF